MVAKIPGVDWNPCPLGSIICSGVLGAEDKFLLLFILFICDVDEEGEEGEQEEGKTGWLSLCCWWS